MFTNKPDRRDGVGVVRGSLQARPPRQGPYHVLPEPLHQGLQLRYAGHGARGVRSALSCGTSSAAAPRPLSTHTVVVFLPKVRFGWPTHLLGGPGPRSFSGGAIWLANAPSRPALTTTLQGRLPCLSWGPPPLRYGTPLTPASSSTQQGCLTRRAGPRRCLYAAQGQRASQRVPPSTHPPVPEHFVCSGTCSWRSGMSASHRGGGHS